MKLLSAVFVLLLLAAHGVGGPDERLGLPLSMFRDGEQGWLGYLLFALLLLIALLSVAALARAGKEDEAISAGLAAVLLFHVAVTPSCAWFHLLFSLGLLLLLYRHYWWLLRESGSPWLLPHLLAPFLLVLATGFHSYGLWQKSLILYVVILANIRHHLLGRATGSRPASVAASRGFDGGRVRGRGKTSRLELRREWARRIAR